MKRKIIIASVALLSLGTGSCKKYLDINTNPNAAETVTPGLLFGYASAAYAGNRASGDSYIPLGLAIQTIASGGDFGWGKGDVYDFSIYSIGNTWKMYYSTSGNNLKLAIENAEKAVPKQNAAAAQSKILLAELMYEATMLWGDIPFSEAWQAKTTPYPKFDDQQSVLKSIVALLDEALAQLPASDPTAITTQDFFYKGNLTNWKAAARSIRFRTLMALVDKDPSVASQIGQMLTEGGMISSAAQNMRFPFDVSPGRENPKYRILSIYGGGKNIFFFANNNVLQPMKDQADPRISKYFDLPTGVTTYNGVESEEEADDNIAKISMNLYKKDAPELIFTHQEQLFLEAEAYARGLGVAQDISMANDKYKEALTAACKYHGVAANLITPFVNNKNLTTAADPVKEIHLQQWIDLMDRPLEAFNVWRRSGSTGNEVPTLTVPTGAPNNGLFRRYIYPKGEEVDLNPNAPKTVVDYYVKLWFDL